MFDDEFIDMQKKPPDDEWKYIEWAMLFGVSVVFIACILALYFVE